MVRYFGFRQRQRRGPNLPGLPESRATREEVSAFRNQVFWAPNGAPELVLSVTRFWDGRQALR